MTAHALAKKLLEGPDLPVVESEHKSGIDYYMELVGETEKLIVNFDRAEDGETIPGEVVHLW